MHQLCAVLGQHVAARDSLAILHVDEGGIVSNGFFMAHGAHWDRVVVLLMLLSVQTLQGSSKRALNGGRLQRLL